jgi:uncharacterized protein YggE
LTIKRAPWFAAALLGVAALVAAACEDGGDTIINSEGSTTTGINVTGTGRVFGTPDVVTLQVGVQAEATTVADAREQAATSATAIINSVRGNGVAAEDVRTSQFSIQPLYEVVRGTTQQIRGYRVDNVVTVTLRRVDQAGKVIDDAARAGGNNTVVRSIQFSIDDPTKYEEQARELAVREAKVKAEQLARHGGVSLGDPITISESGGYQPLFSSPVARSAALDTATPIESGQLEVTVSVSILYRIQ